MGFSGGDFMFDAVLGYIFYLLVFEVPVDIVLFFGSAAVWNIPDHRHPNDFGREEDGAYDR